MKSIMFGAESFNWNSEGLPFCTQEVQEATQATKEEMDRSKAGDVGGMAIGKVNESGGFDIPETLKPSDDFREYWANMIA